MVREPVVRILENTRLANTYGGWIYCEECGCSIGYLCYVTYDVVHFGYTCACGGHGNMWIDFREGAVGDGSCGTFLVGLMGIITCN
jgi:hypothetical protein